jgi:hypothetical protein
MTDREPGVDVHRATQEPIIRSFVACYFERSLRPQLVHPAYGVTVKVARRVVPL